MRRSITAVTSVVVALAAAGCAGGGGGTTLASTTTTPVVTTVPAATTTEAPSTTAAPTTTTTALITDATTADPKALAAQLQAVLDRYQELYIASRTDPERPFTDQKLIDDFHEVAEQHELANLVQIWGQFRNDGSAVHSGPTPEAGGLLTGVSYVSPQNVGMTYCFYDDAVTYKLSSGEVLDDTVEVSHGVVDFHYTDKTWKITRFDTADFYEAVPPRLNPCPNERG